MSIERRLLDLQKSSLLLSFILEEFHNLQRLIVLSPTIRLLLMDNNDISELTHLLRTNISLIRDLRQSWYQFSSVVQKVSEALYQDELDDYGEDDQTDHDEAHDVQTITTECSEDLGVVLDDDFDDSSVNEDEEEIEESIGGHFGDEVPLQIETTRPMAVSSPPESPNREKQKAPKTEKKSRKRARKVLDIHATLCNYFTRCTTTPEIMDSIKKLSEYCILSDFGLLKCLTDQETTTFTRADIPTFTHHAQIIALIANENGIRIGGFTNENKSKGVYTNSIPPSSQRVYIGGKNSFTGHEASVFAMETRDKLYQK